MSVHIIKIFVIAVKEGVILVLLIKFVKLLVIIHGVIVLEIAYWMHTNNVIQQGV